VTHWIMAATVLGLLVTGGGILISANMHLLTQVEDYSTDGRDRLAR
jgi:uncharacterized membrane protein YesL